MSFIHYAAQEIHCKIIYYGPGMSGKTTNIQSIYENTQQPQRGECLQLRLEHQHSLLFDFLPLAIGECRGYRTRFHLYAVPGQSFYEIAQQFLLRGVDGLVFVVDSQSDKMPSNMASFECLEQQLFKQGLELHQLPLVFQYNKRDATNALSISELEATLNPMHYPYTESVAIRHQGVMNTLQIITQSVLKKLKGISSN